jgi:ferredoxin-type protein NapF
MLTVNASRRRLLFGRNAAHEPLPPERTLVAAIGDPCLARRDIVCHSCGDECEAGAVRFRAVVGGVPAPTVDPARCTGCAACVRVCPAAAITMVPGVGARTFGAAGALR